MNQIESPEEVDGSAQNLPVCIARLELEQLAFMARQGSPAACYRLGCALMERSHPECVLWFQSAANQGHAVAAAMLGFIYWSGVPAGVHHAKSFRWFCVAADLGDRTAQRRLGMMYEQGFGCPRDLLKASDWFGKAAAQGDMEAGFLARAARDRILRETGRGSVLARWQERWRRWFSTGLHGTPGKTVLYS